MPARYFLRCLGAPELRAPNGEPIRVRTKKHMALLVYLAVEPRQPHRRERLADLLWPEASPAEGRHSLATALSVIRGKLGPRTYESTRETVRFVAPDLEVDLDRLSRGDVLGDEVTPPLEMGGFLDDFEVTHAPEYVLWRELRRAHWFPSIRKAFVVLMDRCRRTGDFARIEPLADRLLTLDELSEDAIRAKMEGRAFAGDRISAIRIYQEWRRKLEAELGATPSPLVEGMALRLRQRSYEPPGTSHVPTVPTDQWRDRAFVGRASQYRVAYKRWESTNANEGRHVLLLGDSGVGKTTLAERLVTAAGLEGAVSSRVQCYEVEREIPYAAIGTLVRGMLDRPGAGGTSPEWLAELARTVPAVRQRFANLPAPRDTEGEAARLRLTEAVHQLASSIADEHPLILVVDDVHLSDDASVAVLHLLMRRTQEQRIMLVLTAREPELARSPHASRLMDVRRALALEPVELPPLTEEEMGLVVSALADWAGKPLPPAVRRSLLRASAGIPMVAEMLFDDWRAHGDQCLALAIGAMTVDAHGDHQQMFHQVLDRVFQNLTPTARTVLNLAALLGDRLNDLSMYELADLTLAQTLTGMSELTALRILRDGGREMEFRNEMLRGYAYLEVPSPLRRALHGLIADRLMAAEAGGEAIPGLMLAWHCYRAGRISQAEPYLLKGSQQAIDRGGAFEAELALDSAMPTLPTGMAEKAKILLAEALQEQGRWADSMSALIDLKESPTTFQAKRALELNARAATVTDREKLTTLSNEIVEFIEVGPDAEAHSQLCFAISRTAWLGCGQHERLLSALERRYLLAENLSARASLVSAILTCAWTGRQFPQLQRFNVMADAVSKECEVGGLLSGSRFALENTRACIKIIQGDYQSALSHLELVHQIAKRIGDDERMSVAAANLAMCFGRLGQYVNQEDWSRKAIHLTNSPSQRWRLNKARYYLAWSLAMRGDTRAALAEFESFDDDYSAIPVWWGQAAGLLRADIMLVCGETEQGLELARSAFEATGTAPLSPDYTGTVARWIAKLLMAGRMHTDLTTALERLVKVVGEFEMMDQAEILASWCSYRRKCRLDETAERARLAACLAKLPDAVVVQLTRLCVM